MDVPCENGDEFSGSIKRWERQSDFKGSADCNESDQDNVKCLLKS